MKQYCICVVLALMCAGCVSRQMPRLKHLPRSTAAATRHDGVEVRAQVLGDKAVTHVLGGYHFLSRGPRYTAIHVTVENNTSSAVVFDARALQGFIDADALAMCWLDRRIAERVYSDEAGSGNTEFMIGGTALGVALAGAAGYMIANMRGGCCGCETAGYACLLIGSFVPLALVLSAFISDPVADARRLILQLRERVLDELVVEPHEMGSALVFVKQDPALKELALPVSRVGDKQALLTVKVPLNLVVA